MTTEFIASSNCKQLNIAIVPFVSKKPEKETNILSAKTIYGFARMMAIIASK